MKKIRKSIEIIFGNCDIELIKNSLIYFIYIKYIYMFRRSKKI